MNCTCCGKKVNMRIGGLAGGICGMCFQEEWKPCPAKTTPYCCLECPICKGIGFIRRGE